MGNKPSSPSAREDANTTRRNNASSYPTEEISPSQSSLSRSRRGNANVAGNRRARSTSSPTHQMASNGSGENGSTEIINATPDVDIPCEEEAEVEDRPGEMSWYQMAKAGYQELVNAIIRPPRAKYKTSALGPQEFEFLGKAFKRTDFRLLNERANVLECSHWKPHGWRRAEQLPCIVYMHGNSSARLEAVPQLSLALSLGATMVAFDFAGSGRSGGDYVSLGYYERDDLKAVVEHLRKSGEVGAIALWGRSMGAATALLHGDRDMSIAALVLDSAFADLTQLAEEMVERGREAGLTVPGFVVKAVLRMIRGSVMKTAGFNIRDLCPIAHADRTFIPALFIAGREDDFIRPHHSQQIHDAYAGDKNIVLVEGDHNSPRPRFLFDSVYIFLQNYLQVPPDWSLDRGDAMMGYPPWYHVSGSMAGGGAGGMAAMYGANPSTGVETDLTDYVDWEGIALEDVGVDGASDIGMTAERQAEFQTALFHMLAQERNELSAPTVQDAEGRKPPAPGPAPAIASAVASGSDNRRASPRSSSLDPPAAISSTDSAGNNTSLSSTSDAGMEPDNSEDEAGVPAVAAVAIAARTARENAARKSAAAAEAAAAKAAAEEEEGGELSALGDFVAPSGVGRPAMAPFSVSDTSDVWEMDGPFSPDDGKSIPKARARVGSTSGVSGASGAAGGHNGRGSASVVGEREGGMGGHLLHDTDDTESFVSHDSGFGAATLNCVKGIDGKGPSLERGRQNGSFGDSYVWGGGKLVSAALGVGGASSGAIVIDAIGEWSCRMCTLINNSAATECLACGSSRAVG